MGSPKSSTPRMFLIALGSNISGEAGEPRAMLAEALAALEARGARVAARSSWWHTPAHPPGSGPDFVNAAAQVEAGVSPQGMLDVLHDIEAALGRLRPRRWAPRVCDLDLLAAGDAVLPDPATLGDWMGLAPAEQAVRVPEALLLPHPRLHERAFVLMPLAEIAAGWVHPLLGRTVRELLDDLPVSALQGIHRLRAPA